MARTTAPRIKKMGNRAKATSPLKAFQMLMEIFKISFQVLAKRSLTLAVNILKTLKSLWMRAVVSSPNL
jgi:hypothetical protein